MTVRLADLEAGRRAAASSASPTRTRRCCATSPSAGSRSATALDVLERQPFDGPVSVRLGGREHVLGGLLAAAMRIELDD